MNRRERPARHQSRDIHSELQNAYVELKENNIHRREFLRRAAMLAATCVVPVLQAQVSRAEDAQASIVFKDEPWQTIHTVQQHLLPSEADSPGANEINATEYLKSILGDNFLDEEEKKFILNGPVWLNDLAISRYSKSFAQLNHDEQNTLLRQIAKSTAGENWLATLLSYIFEALLTAPIYGGNPGGVGWKWLRHQPGFPLPDKMSLTWQQLQKR